MNTHNLKVDFGKHEGERYTRLPVSYLNWMVNNNHSKKEIAQAELERRGTTMPTLELSGHAIDRFSQLAIDQWYELRNNTEGLHSFLLINAQQAIDRGEKITESKFKWMNLYWIFDFGSCYPTLKTIHK